jgi:hypothetical protein
MFSVVHPTANLCLRSLVNAFLVQKVVERRPPAPAFIVLLVCLSCNDAGQEASFEKGMAPQSQAGNFENPVAMPAVCLDTQQSSLREILRLATGELGMRCSGSVAAFCQAAARFSPGVDI